MIRINKLQEIISAGYIIHLRQEKKKNQNWVKTIEDFKQELANKVEESKQKEVKIGESMNVAI